MKVLAAQGALPLANGDVPAPGWGVPSPTPGAQNACGSGNTRPHAVYSGSLSAVGPAMTGVGCANGMSATTRAVMSVSPAIRTRGDKVRISVAPEDGLVTSGSPRGHAVPAVA